MKKLVLVLCVLVMTGCTPETSESHNYVLPPELSHCKIYRMRGVNAKVMVVVHCPNSETTTKRGVSSTTVVDTI